MKSNKKVLIFDIDGVLIDVSNSYRLAIKKTVEFFLGKLIDKKEVDEIKLKSGFNDDYDCTEALLEQHGKKIPQRYIIKKFQEYYLGRNFNGLIQNEKLLLNQKLIEKLSKKYTLAIFTGRPKEEAIYPLKKYNIKKNFKTIIAVEDVKHKKPQPEGILKILKRLKTKKAYYIGDSIDDLLAAKNANIDFIGILPPYADKKALKKILKENGANIILNNINKIIGVIK